MACCRLSAYCCRPVIINVTPDYSGVFFARRKEEQMNQVLFSGSAPSGNLTIGNYIGAIRQWKKFQDSCDSIFCIVDLHAITLPKDPEYLRQKSLEFFALYIACGLDPEKSLIFIQSDNPDHAELCWILSCMTSFGDLSRMTQFREKAGRRNLVPSGLFFYPVLMAADILLYETEIVPVGEDQTQHIELCRTIAKKVNSAYGDIFRVPEGFTPESGGRIKNLLDPSQKMDKSHENPKTYISLTDTDDEIKPKIMKAVTDSRGDFRIDDENEGIANLVTMMAVLSGTQKKETADQYSGRGYGELKKDLAEILIEEISPIRNRFNEIRNDKAELEKLLYMGKLAARRRSRIVMQRVKEAFGLRA